MNRWACRTSSASAQLTYPSRLPLTQLDFVYARGLKPVGLRDPARAHLVAHVRPPAADRGVQDLGTAMAAPHSSLAQRPPPAAAGRQRRAVPGPGGRHRRRAARGAAGDLHLRLQRQRREVAYALERAARRGVSVQVVVDGVGTRAAAAGLVQRLEAGVHWRVYSPPGPLGLLWPGKWRRLHRKLCVVDGAGGLSAAASTSWTTSTTPTTAAGGAALRLRGAGHRAAGGRACRRPWSGCGGAWRRCATAQARLRRRA